MNEHYTRRHKLRKGMFGEKPYANYGYWVREGMTIDEAGDALTDGPLIPHDLLKIKGEEALQRYLISEIQNVYRSQNVDINDLTGQK